MSEYKTIDELIADTSDVKEKPLGKVIPFRPSGTFGEKLGQIRRSLTKIEALMKELKASPRGKSNV